MPQPLRSLVAVLAGFLSMAVIVIALTLLCVKFIHLNSGHPTPLYLTLNVLYCLAAALLGGLITAKIARRSPLAHGLALALLMFVLGVLSYTTHPPGQPLWYQIFLTIAPPLAAIAGAAAQRIL
jgi:putative membrane protein (TIGR04086 family)